jgi:hypothetical protein
VVVSTASVVDDEDDVPLVVALVSLVELVSPVLASVPEAVAVAVVRPEVAVVRVELVVSSPPVQLTIQAKVRGSAERSFIG